MKSKQASAAKSKSRGICYPTDLEPMIVEAELKAKRQWMSFSKYVLSLIDADLKRK